MLTFRSLAAPAGPGHVSAVAVTSDGLPARAFGVSVQVSEDGLRVLPKPGRILSFEAVQVASGRRACMPGLRWKLCEGQSSPSGKEGQAAAGREVHVTVARLVACGRHRRRGAVRRHAPLRRAAGHGSGLRACSGRAAAVSGGEQRDHGPDEGHHVHAHGSSDGVQGGRVR